MAVSTPVCDFGTPAPDFSLPATDGSIWTLERARGPNGTLVVFMCNHCPYVKAIIDRLIRDARDLEALGVSTVAICSNDPVAYPEDDLDHMRRWAEELRFPFPYLHDETQAVARAYGAVCTPDFFGYDRDLKLQYRGRLDSSGRLPAAPDVRRELFEAMAAVARGEPGPAEQVPSMGCSIKWKTAA
jgi:peroxiredoxin